MDEEFLALLIYVDDVIVTGTSITAITSVKKALHDKFTIKDLGPLKYFPGLEVARSDSGIIVSQRKFILDLIQDTGLSNAKAVTSPLPIALHLSPDTGDLLPNPNQYRRLVGRLLYVNLTRPDISYAVQHLSQFMSAPRMPHWIAALHVVKYLKSCPSKGLFFPVSNDIQLSAFCDTDWASSTFSRKSLTGYCVFFWGAFIYWKTKKQATVSKSSAEAEYRAMAATVCELLWITYVLRDLQVSVMLPIPLYCDNKAALHIASNPVFHERTKHLEIDCHNEINYKRAL
ncbi:uncharacterized mitochondrial protein AtMg00810-like [Hevea brasiliensis]|uniref:uncharacterized mitochondrial protein AtMg00810-like n=1 Tax=Hevea brasiliensis TaxID=3981 RepID=UPI0025DE097F|nr:uncharacterized mitochondrial protein AtMg00810-like [Hevea brasiliensis]